MPVLLFYSAVMSDCTFAVFKVDLPLDHGTACPSDGGVDRSLGRLEYSADNSEIFPCDLVAYAMPESMLELTICLATTVSPEVSRSNGSCTGR